MADETRSGEVEFTSARDQIETAIETHTSGTIAEIPTVVAEKGEIKFAFNPIGFDDAKLFQALGAVKKYIEHIRVHTYEPGYIVYQSLGENLYNTKEFSTGTKFKFISIGATTRVEIVRRGNFTQDEIQACIHLFQLFHPKGKKNSPVDLLRQLGVSVFQEAADANAWARIAGYERTKQEVQESIIMPLRNPEIFLSVASLTRGQAHNNIPKAILFEGPPGVGKTTMARIIALETGIPMVYVPVENILSKYYGESAQNLAAIFDAASQFDRVILFLDEIDSLAGSREDGMFEATRRVLSVLLRKIDGFEQKDSVLTLGATNRQNDLDHALLSRFDQTISFPLPNPAERASIFRSYAKHLTPAELSQISAASEGLSGRTIEDICETAERRHARQLITSGQPVSAPPSNVYYEIAKQKANP